MFSYILLKIVDVLSYNLIHFSNEFKEIVYLFQVNLFEISLVLSIVLLFTVYIHTKDNHSYFEHSIITPGILKTSREIGYLFSRNVINVERLKQLKNKAVFSENSSENSEVKSQKLNDLVFMLDSMGLVLHANQDTLNELDMGYKDTLGESIFDIYARFNYFDKSWFDNLRADNKTKIIIKVHEQNEKWYMLTHSVNLDLEGNIESILITGNDVSFLIDSIDMKNIYAEKDYLTGLINQYGMHEKIKNLEHIKKAASFFIQVLHFTEITNYYGHEIGDKLLNEVVRELQNIVSEDCIIARYANSKFVILCIDESIAGDILDKLKTFISSSYIIDKINLQVDKRIGYAFYPEDTDDLEDLLTLSSIALKETILSNSFSMVKFENKMRDKLKYNVEIANKLKDALDNDLIEVHFQKIMDCKTKKMYILEELSRWNDKDLGYIPPIDFFRIAKNTNQLSRLDRYMVEKSILAFKELQLDKQYDNVKLTINISPESLLDSSFKDFINRILRRVKIDPVDIFIEISETTFVNNLDLCIDRINSYKDNGFKIALDDFGTEYSSLSVLESVDFDIIKIDRHFINNIQKAGNLEIIKMIRKITNISNKEIVAEGVETKEQSELLKILGCSIQQGFYLHRPENLNIKKELF